MTCETSYLVLESGSESHAFEMIPNICDQGRESKSELDDDVIDRLCNIKGS